MKKICGVVLVFIATLISCSSSANDNVNTVKIDVQNVSTQLLSDIFTKIEIIELGVVDSAYFGSIDKIEMVDSLIFILDKDYTNQILKYNKDGVFLGRIGIEGQGPNEYQNLNDFAVISTTGKEKELWALDYGGGYVTVVKYDLSGRFIEKIRTEFIADSFVYLFPDRLVFSTSNQCNDDFCTTFFATDLEFSLTELGPSSLEPYRTLWVEPSSPISSVNGLFSGVSFGDNAIYNYSTLNGFSKMRSIDFGEAKTIDELSTNYPFYESYLQDLKNDYIYHIDNIFYNDSALMFSFIYGTNEITYLKKRSSEYLIDKFIISEEINLSSMPIYGRFENGIYVYLDEEEIDQVIEKVLKENKTANLGIFHKLKTSDGFNPCIIKLEF